MKLGKYSIQKNKHGTLEDLEDIATNYILKIRTDRATKQSNTIQAI